MFAHYIVSSVFEQFISTCEDIIIYEQLYNLLDSVDSSKQPPVSKSQSDERSSAVELSGNMLSNLLGFALLAIFKLMIIGLTKTSNYLFERMQDPNSESY